MLRNILNNSLRVLAPVSLLLAFFPVDLAGAAEDTNVAIVGNKTITLKDFNNKYDEVLRTTVNAPAKEVFLEDLVRYEMGVQEAEKKHLEQDPIVKERFKQELYKALIEKEIGKQVSDIKVTEEEMKSYYEKNPELRSSHILFEFKPDATPAQKAEAKERATKIYDEVRKSKRPFEELVAIYTDDVITKKTGGDIGWQSRLSVVPAYYDALEKMKVGEIRGLIETQYGYHIVKLTGRNTYAEANKRQIRTAVFDQKRKKLFDEYFNKLKKIYPVKLNKSALEK